MISPRLSGIIAVGAAALLLTSCSAGAEEPVLGIDSLTIATLGPVTATQQAFLDRLEVLSEGDISVDMQADWTGEGESDEIALTEAVASGEVDLAWVTVRSLSALGLTAIDALETPMLIQTHDQQREVATGVAGELVTRQLNDSPVAGLAMYPGPQQFPMGGTAPLLDVADWAGRTVEFAPGSNDGSVVAETITTLGGTPSGEGSDPVADIVAGSVQAGIADPADLVAGGATGTGPFMTVNVPLFPAMGMIIINRDVLESLSTRQHGFIEAAVERSQDAAMVPPDTATPITEACAAGVRFSHASSDQVTAFLAAVQPIYQALEKDPEEQRLFEAITDAVRSKIGTGALGFPSECIWVAPAA